MMGASPRGVKINRATANCLQRSLSQTLHHGSRLGNSDGHKRKRFRFSFLSFDCVCKWIPFVWININSARLPHICISSEAHSPFSVAGSSAKLALQLSRPPLITIIISISMTVAVKASCFVALSAFTPRSEPHPAFNVLDGGRWTSGMRSRSLPSIWSLLSF